MTLTAQQLIDLMKPLPVEVHAEMPTSPYSQAQIDLAVESFGWRMVQWLDAWCERNDGNILLATLINTFTVSALSEDEQDGIECCAPTRIESLAALVLQLHEQENPNA